ncbi:fumarylacetoacetate hydrolase family protein [Paenibacillus sp. ACRRX]|uniref:fumarylacetoacetate hydrolase family protein n=1 Tax=Paenibacillus sp. ACRRX TaxID=2918206 RepID=UPI001EF62EEF|nr:fumarylacetoacetate hydrolase family protein [Paenibacillus sp. ACRRX]MCG7407232.1 fumarylacetoacetate hydrolase family protein [Paenibacillus sp. ACRRX]
MKLLTYYENHSLKTGVKTSHGIVDISNVGTMHEIIADKVKLEQARTAAEQSDHYLDETKLQLGPCVPDPGKIICVGLNYRKHAEETNASIPQHPILFNKFNNTVAACGDDIALPVKVTSEVDYEAELVIVIGKAAKYVDKDQALAHVFGYCNVNDLSARDLQMRTQQWLLGKSCDGFSPLGPYLVTADEVGNPNQLAISCTVNGEVRQSSNTSDMIFYCDEIVSYISQHMSLAPGDIILTGTPEGVVLGLPPEERVYLQDGDIVTIEIEGLGKLTNRMVNEMIKE